MEGGGDDGATGSAGYGTGRRTFGRFGRGRGGEAQTRHAHLRRRRRRRRGVRCRHLRSSRELGLKSKREREVPALSASQPTYPCNQAQSGRKGNAMATLSVLK